MDPFAAIGLAGNIVAFIDFGFKLVSQSKSIYTSASGASAHNEDAAFTTQQLQRVSGDLQMSKPTASTTKAELALYELATECSRLSADLMKLLEELKSKNPKSKRASFRTAIRDWRKKDEKTELEVKLDRCRQQLNLQLANLTRSDLAERLHKLVEFGQANATEMQSLAKNMESLREGSNVSNIGPEALDQIKSLLRLTGVAALRVRHARILGGLRFDAMNERFEDIEEAHSKTFEWIFDGTADSVDVIDTKSSIGSSHSHYSSPNGEAHEVGNAVDSRPEQVMEDERPPSGPVASNLDPPLVTVEGHRGELVEINTLKDGDEMVERHAAENEIRQTKADDEDSNPELPQLDDGSNPDSTMRGDDISIRSARQAPPHLDPSRPLAFPPGESAYLPCLAVDAPQPRAVQEARDRFIDWLRVGEGVFHISGKPGSGKSTFLKFMCQHPKTEGHLRAWAGDKDLVVGKFFFWNPGSDLQKSLKGLVRGLLHCLLSNSPDLIPFAFPALWEASAYTENMHIEPEECREGFNRLISQSSATMFMEHKFVFFIDGLDEYAGSHAELIRKLFEWTDKTQSVKICVSSREWAVFQEAFRNCPKLRLHELTQVDIQRFVNSRLGDLGLLPPAEDSGGSNAEVSVLPLEHAIVANSNGVFLWVSLILRHIEDGIANGDDMDDLVKVVDTLPTELEPMLRQIMNSIPSTSRKLAYALLSLAYFLNTYSDDYCRVMQFSFMEEYLRDNNFATKATVRLFSEGENTRRLEKATKRIYGVCKGFLELRPHYSSTRRHVVEISDLLGPVVRFTHRSVVDFLGSPDFKQKMEKELPGFEPHDADCQTFLGTLQGIKLPRFYFAPSLASQNRAAIRAESSWVSDGFKGSPPSLYAPLILTGGGCSVAPSPSLQPDLQERMARYYEAPMAADAAVRFGMFLGALYRTLLELDLAALKTGTKMGRRSIICSPPNVVVLMSAACGFYEHVEERGDMSSVLKDGCLIFCLSSLWSMGACPPQDRLPQAMDRMFTTLEILFSQGASADFQLGDMKVPAFHVLLAERVSLHPNLALVALMLYHGADPRKFAVELQEQPLPEDFVNTVYQVHFRAEACQSKSSLGAMACAPVRIPGPPNPIESENPKSDFVVRLLPNTMESEIVDKFGTTLDLGTLVSVWFPDHGSRLLPVIDWVFKLNGPMDDSSRLQLQSEFGRVLRPFFDAEDPEFIGWDAPTQPFPAAWDRRLPLSHLTANSPRVVPEAPSML